MSISIGYVNYHYTKPVRVVDNGYLNASYSGSTLTVSSGLNMGFRSSSGNRFGTWFAHFNLIDTLNLVVDGELWASRDAVHGYGGSNSTDFSLSTGDVSRVVTTGVYHTISVYVHCNDSDCDCGANSGWGILIGSFSQFVPNPYSEFTLSINSVTTIGKVDRDTFTVNYYLNGGTDNIQTCQLRIYSGGTRIETINIGTGKSGDNQTASFSPRTTTYQHGSNYSVSVYAYDGTTEKETGKLTFYTYQEPLLSSVSAEKTSPQNANTSNKFTLNGTNNRKWTSYEDEFQTQYRIRRQDGTYTSWTNLDNITQWSRTAEQMRTLIPKQYDGQTNTIYFRRYNSRASWYSSERGVVMMLYYRPRMAVDSNSVTYHMNSTSGSLINKGQVITNTTTLNSIYVNWKYDSTLSKAGYVQGYRIRLYNYQNNLVRTYYKTNKYIEIPKEDIPRLNMTYIDITPYFGNDTNNTSNYWYYNGTIRKIQFIRLVTELEKPQITYPVQNSIWINKDFRVCFKLPTDPDKGYETETYHYENIELKVNKIVYRLTTSNGTTSGSVDGSTIFSCLSNNLTYQRPVVIYPNLLGNVPSTDTYTIQVRVKKKYGTTSREFRWSPWSDIRTFTVDFPLYEVKKDDLIMATHYNDAFDTVDNVRNTYGVSWTDKPLRVVAKSTIIKAEQYSYNTIMKKIVDTKNRVNTYANATFDTNRNNIKFDYTNELPETFNERVGEFITADKNEGNEYNGRNYIKFIYDRCKLLK